MTPQDLQDAITVRFRPNRYALHPTTAAYSEYYNQCVMDAIRATQPSWNVFLEWTVANNKTGLLQYPWLYDTLSQWQWDRHHIQELFTAYHDLTNRIPHELHSIYRLAYQRNPADFDSDLWHGYLERTSKLCTKDLSSAQMSMIGDLPSNRLAQMIIARWGNKYTYSHHDRSDNQWFMLSVQVQPSDEANTNRILTQLMNLMFTYTSGRHTPEDGLRVFGKTMASTPLHHLPIVQQYLDIILNNPPNTTCQAQKNIMRGAFLATALQSSNPLREQWEDTILQALQRHPKIFDGMEILLQHAALFDSPKIQRFLWENTSRGDIKNYNDLNIARNLWKKIFHVSKDHAVRTDIIWQFARYPSSFVDKPMITESWSKEMKATLFTWLVQRGHHGRASSYGPNMSRHLKKLLTKYWPEWKDTDYNTHTSEWITKAKALYDIPDSAYNPGLGAIGCSLFDSMPLIRDTIDTTKKVMLVEPCVLDHEQMDSLIAKTDGPPTP